MDLDLEGRKLTELEHLRRMRLRELRQSGLAVVAVGVLAILRDYFWNDGGDHAQQNIRSISGPLLFVAGLVLFPFFALMAVFYYDAVRRIFETRAMQEAIRVHHDLPSETIARLVGKRLQWRALCYSGAVMAVSISALAAIVYSTPRSRFVFGGVGFYLLPIIIWWSTARFGIAAVRFIRYARP